MRSEGDNSLTASLESSGPHDGPLFPNLLLRYTIVAQGGYLGCVVVSSVLPRYLGRAPQPIVRDSNILVFSEDIEEGANIGG